jgi:hypothetical protein
MVGTLDNNRINCRRANKMAGIHDWLGLLSHLVIVTCLFDCIVSRFGGRSDALDRADVILSVASTLYYHVIHSSCALATVTVIWFHFCRCLRIYPIITDAQKIGVLLFGAFVVYIAIFLKSPWWMECIVYMGLADGIRSLVSAVTDDTRVQDCVMFVGVFMPFYARVSTRGTISISDATLYFALLVVVDHFTVFYNRYLGTTKTTLKSFEWADRVYHQSSTITSPVSSPLSQSPSPSPAPSPPPPMCETR